MNFWGWFWHLLLGLPWGMIGTLIAAVLFVIIGVMEVTWRLFRGVGALTQARKKIHENAIDWRLWAGLTTMIGVLCLSMFAFYVVQLERRAVLPIGWRDGRLFLLCAILGSWAFGLAVFKLTKGEIDWRLTTVFCMLGWLCIAGAGSWLRIPQPDNATEEYLRAVQRLKLLPGSDDGPKWIGWSLLAGGVFLILIVPALGARLWWQPNGGRMRAEARKAKLEASILHFKRTRGASAVVRGSPILERAAEVETPARSMWDGVKWATVWWFLCWFSSWWDVRAAVVAGLFASAFTWRMLSGLASIIELLRTREMDEPSI